MDSNLHEIATRVRSMIAGGRMPPTVFRSALMGVPLGVRDAWIDAVLGTEEVPADGDELPRGCVPYLPCSVHTVLRMVTQAEVQAHDIFVDVGSGVGRSAALIHLLTGASVIGIEIQTHLLRASRALTARLGLSRLSMIHGDAVRLAGFLTIGSVFFFYCPFSGERLGKVLDDLEPIARTRPIRVCCVDVPLPPRSWLSRLPLPDGDLAIYRSTHATLIHHHGAGTATRSPR